MVDKDAARSGDSIDIPGDYQYKALTQGSPIQRYWHASKQKLLDLEFPVGPSDVALDCGCGSGVISAYLAEKCSEVVGVDGNPRAIDFAMGQFRQRNLKFLNAMVEDIGYAPGYFTRIVCMELIEHLYEPQVRSLLRRFYELLAPGGRLFVTTPNYHGLWPVVEWLVDRSGKVPHMDEDQHVTHYYRGKLLREMQEAALNIRATGTFCTFAPFSAPLGEKIADSLFRIEHRFALPFGNLLYAVGERPAQ